MRTTTGEDICSQWAWAVNEKWKENKIKEYTQGETADGKMHRVESLLQKHCLPVHF